MAGSLYFATDYNYRKASALIYAHPQGIVFLNAGWTRKSAGQLITQALRYSDGEYLGVVVMRAEMQAAGGVSQFAALQIPIILGKTIERQLRQTWLAANQRMWETFPSWRPQVLPGADIIFRKSFHFMKGAVVIYQLGILAIAAPAQCVVLFPLEKILYVDALERTLSRMKDAPRERLLKRLKKLPFEKVLTSQAAKLIPRHKFFANLINN